MVFCASQPKMLLAADLTTFIYSSVRDTESLFVVVEQIKTMRISLSCFRLETWNAKQYTVYKEPSDATTIESRMTDYERRSHFANRLDADHTLKSVRARHKNAPRPKSILSFFSLYSFFFSLSLFLSCSVLFRVHSIFVCMWLLWCPLLHTVRSGVSYDKKVLHPNKSKKNTDTGRTENTTTIKEKN